MSTVLWLLGPSSQIWNGVSKYSTVIIDELSQADIQVIKKTIPYEPRTLGRYLYQFFWFPIWIIVNRVKAKDLVLYQEDLCFLIPIARMLNYNVIVIYHHAPELKVSRGIIEKSKTIYLKLMLFLVRFANKIICPTNISAKEISKVAHVKLSKFSIIPNGFVDSSNSYNEKSRRDLFNDFGLQVFDKDIVILNVGSCENRKNIISALKALLNLPSNYIFVQVGNPVSVSNLNEIKNIADNNNLRFHHLSKVSEEKLQGLFSSSDLYISPSTHEGFGRTVIEAQMNGLPVIASNIDVYSEVLGESFVPVVDFYSPNEWAQKIQLAIQENQVLTEKGLLNSKRFTSSLIATKFLSVLQRVRHD